MIQSASETIVPGNSLDVCHITFYLFLIEFFTFFSYNKKEQSAKKIHSGRGPRMPVFTISFCAVIVAVYISDTFFLIPNRFWSFAICMTAPPAYAAWKKTICLRKASVNKEFAGTSYENNRE